MVADGETGPILLYDGVCGLCSRLVQFVLKRDRRNQFRFAPLQGGFAARALARHGKDPADLDTVYVVVSPEQPDEQLLPRSQAIIYILRRLRRAWPLLAFLGRILPRSLADWLYGQVARRRYRIFGKYDACPLPSSETRARFLE
jgi:predicted DCC family thiol-disulfide oxidoreductase YuxK